MQTADSNTIIMGESPFKPEYDEYIGQYPGRGSLKIQVSVARDAFPVEGVLVDVSSVVNGTNPETAGKGEAEYLVSLFHPAFKEVIDCPVKVLDRIETILPVTLTPSVGNTEDR